LYIATDGSAEIVKRIYEEYIEGKSFDAIRRSLFNEDIMKFVAVQVYWNAQNKVVITNRYFTKSAILSAERNNNNVKLIDRDDLQLLLREYRDCLENKNLFSFFPLRKQANN
jgi:restriction endonuclease Mrr